MRQDAVALKLLHDEVTAAAGGFSGMVPLLRSVGRLSHPALLPGQRANSFGMRFVRVGALWVSVWETRVLDFAFFLQADGRGVGEAGDFWKRPGLPLLPTQPVVGVD